VKKRFIYTANLPGLKKFDMHYRSETKSKELRSYCRLFMEFFWYDRRELQHR